MTRSIAPVLLFLWAAAVLLTGCITMPLGKSGEGAKKYQASAFARLDQGETLDDVARKYNTSTTELVRYNKLASADAACPGDLIRIPPSQLPPAAASNYAALNPLNGARDFGSAASAKVAAVMKPAGSAVTRALGSTVPGGSNPGPYYVSHTPATLSAYGMSWPLPGRVSRGFDGCGHNGLDICAGTGTPIYAAKSGVVIYSDNKLSGYGNLVIIDHGSGITSIYGHNSRNLVSVGDVIRQGQRIAEVGQTGNATTPHCHFEVRRGAVPIDPKQLLPS